MSDLELLLESDIPEPFNITVYYDYKHGRYWKQDARGVWITIPETSVRRYLKEAGFSAKAFPGQTLSEIDARFNEIQRASSVDYSGPLAGYNTGVYEICGNRVLVTSSPALIEPAEGEWRTIRSFLENLIRDPDHNQFDYLLGWLKVATECLASGNKRPGQALVLAGAAGSGKSLLQNLISQLLGGRSAKPYRYMSGATQFNADLFYAEHQMIEDDVSSTDIRSRRHFGSHVKQFAVNQTQSCHPKGQTAISLTPFWRVSISVNEEPENLMILPVLDESLQDKVMLLKTNKCDMPMPVGTIEQRNAFWAALTSELPAFLHFLNTYEIPSELKDDRYGITTFHHPDLLAAMDDLAPEIRLLSLMDQCLWQEEIGEGKLKVKKNNPLTFTAEGLEALLTCSQFSNEVKKLLGWNNATGTYLGRLAKKFPTRVQQDRTATSRGWKIFHPTLGQH